MKSLSILRSSRKKTNIELTNFGTQQKIEENSQKQKNHLFPTDESGYKSVVNPLAIDINKPEEERKKFRHYWNQFRLIKTDCGPHKFITKILNIKKQISNR